MMHVLPEIHSSQLNVGRLDSLIKSSYPITRQTKQNLETTMRYPSKSKRFWSLLLRTTVQERKMNRCMEGMRCMFFTQQLYFTLAPSAAATAAGEAREFANSGTKRAMGRINIAERASVHESRRRNAQHGSSKRLFAFWKRLRER